MLLLTLQIYEIVIRLVAEIVTSIAHYKIQHTFVHIDKKVSIWCFYLIVFEVQVVSVIQACTIAAKSYERTLKFIIILCTIFWYYKLVKHISTICAKVV